MATYCSTHQRSSGGKRSGALGEGKAKTQQQHDESQPVQRNDHVIGHDEVEFSTHRPIEDHHAAIVPAPSALYQDPPDVVYADPNPSLPSGHPRDRPLSNPSRGTVLMPQHGSNPTIHSDDDQSVEQTL